MSLNPHQLEAVRHLDTPLLVVAGAGSGKTRVITEKIAHLVRNGLAPEHIAAVTFTNKAAREMHRRVSELLGREGVRGIRVSTFHSLGLSILRTERDRLGLRAGFSIFDPLDAVTRVSELLLAEGAKAQENAELVQRQLSRWKGQLITPEEATRLGGKDPTSALAAKLFSAYNEALRVCNAVDLDDLIYLPVKLFESDHQALAVWRDQIRYLLVDEYQDTNAMQYKLVRQLVGDRGCLTAVGDDDQSIYSWRGALPENLGRLQQDFENLRVITLDQNYRSRGAILKTANLLIGNNPHVFEKSLWSGLGYGEPPRVMIAADESAEAEQVAYDLNHHRFMHGGGWSDYAILYRGNHQARLFERSLRQLNIPYRISGGTSFFALTEIRDVMSYLRVLVNLEDDNAFLRIANTPRRGLGTSTLNKLGVFAAEKRLSLFSASFDAELVAQLSTGAAHALTDFVMWLSRKSEHTENMGPGALVKELLEEIDYREWLEGNAKEPKQAERRWRNVGDLSNWIDALAHRSPDAGLTGIIGDLALMDMLDGKNEEEESDCARLMTLHAAKGLEFPHVYLVGMEEGLLPHRQSLEGDAVEEERRLAYVGITRAQQSLCMSFTRIRTRYGEVIDTEPSRFLEEMKDADLRWDGSSKSRKKAATMGAPHCRSYAPCWLMTRLYQQIAVDRVVHAS